MRRSRIKLIYKLYASITHKHITYLHTPFYSKIVAFSLSKKTSASYCDLFIAFGSPNIAYFKSQTPIVYVTDAVYFQMVNYYWNNVPCYFQKRGNLIELKALENSFLTVVSSDWTKNAAIEHYNISENKVRVIEFGANIRDFSISLKLENRNKKIKMLFIGVDIVRKGVAIALEVNKVLREKYNLDSSLTVIGGKIESEDIQDSQVNWIGFLDKNKKEDFSKFEKIISESDLFILPTRAECAGIVFAEASAYGLPIFTYDTGGIANYVINGVNGYRLDLKCGASEYAKKIYETWENNEFEQLSEGGKMLYKEKLNWISWKKHLFQRLQG